MLDYKATPLLDYRIQQSNSIEETLFVLTTLGDDRTVRETYAAGRCVHQRSRQSPGRSGLVSRWVSPRGERKCTPLGPTRQTISL